MLKPVPITQDYYYVGGSDRRIALFENAFPVQRGVSYNSYLLLDDKTALFDTVDGAVQDEFLRNVEQALDGRTLDYLVVHHMEPDHSASFMKIVERYPEITIVANAKIKTLLFDFFGFESDNFLLLKDGDNFSTGKHEFSAVFAPMVHWPEVMFTFDKTAGILFSADAFGTFGALGGSIFADETDFEREFLDDARRYYFNIVGKYGVQVQNVLKKAAALDIRMICPLHGPIWRENLGWFLQKYSQWSAYEPEEKGLVIFYGSIYGHTKAAAEYLASEAARLGVKNVKVFDVSVTDRSYLVSEAFRYSHVVFASVTYNAALFLKMEDLIRDLKALGYKNRKFAVVENGSWSPQAGNLLIAELSSWKEMTQIGDKVTVLSAVKEKQAQELSALAGQLAKDLQ